MRMGEKFACAQTARRLRSNETEGFECEPGGVFAGMQTLRTADERFTGIS